MYKIYFDGSKKEDYISYGYIIYHNNKIIVKNSGCIMNKNLSSYLAELYAMILAIQHAQLLHIKEILVYGDCKNVIDQAKKQNRIKNDTAKILYSYLDEIKKNFVSIDFFWIPRKENKLADRETK
jgi:ribonuclease HI